MNKYHPTATLALRAAYFDTPSVVAYRQGKGWTVYHPSTPTPGTEPEFFCVAPGKTPVPLTELAVEVWMDVLKSLRSKSNG